MSEPRLLLEVVGANAPTVELPRAGVLTVGSAAGRADVVVPGQGVADVHCAIGRAKGGGWALKDLGSSYGTLVNGQRAQTVKLSAGDEIVIGSRRLRVVDPEAAPAPRPAAAPPAPQPMTRSAGNGLPRIEGYVFEKRLGRGGMGQVYLAVQQSLQRRVALKVLSDELTADADFVRRFQAEARAAAALNHPNIVTVHDVWEEGGRHWLAMEYMDRGTLEMRVASEGALPWREALDVLSDAAKGLVYAELRGIVHRDIKPANLMRNEVGTTKISDLGLATHLEAEATDEGDRKIFGTPHFISPEQARGERVDARSDLYSLGATAYRLLTGHTPFEGATTREILRGHFFEAPRAVREFAGDVPGELDALVLRLLAKKPEERFPSAGALLQELERLRSVLVHGVTTSAQAPSGRPRWGTALVALLVVVGAFIAWRTFFASPGDSQTAIVPTPAPESDPQTGGQAPAPDETEAAPVVGQKPPAEDDESALERLEAEAERAWRALPDDLTDAERRDALTRLVREHAGSSWSARFEAEAAALDQRLQSSQARSAENERAAAEALDRLRAAARGPQGPLPLDAALTAMLAVSVDPALAGDDAFRPRWFEAWRAVVSSAGERARASLGAANERVARGEFEGLALSLGAALAALSEEGLPTLPDELAAELAEPLGALRTTRAEIDRVLAGLELERARFERAQILADRGAYASAARGPGALEQELRAFDLDAVDARLTTLESQLAGDAPRAEVAALRGDLTAGRRAFQTLASAWEGNGWKRRTVNDPRTRGRVHREAVGADARGVLLKEGERSELVPWAQFCGRPLELHQLFLERLVRSYTPQELEGIEALLRISAVLSAIDEGAEMLVPASGRVFTEEEARSLVEGFELAAGWAAQAGNEARLRREASAAALLTGALRGLSEERWDEATTLLERLLAEHRETLLVRLLSDGRDLAGLPPAPIVEPAAQPIPPEPPEERDG